MKYTPLIDQIRHLPTPAEPQKSKSYISKLEENLKKNANYDKYFNSFSKKEETLMLLGSIFGNSPFLSQCINKNPIFFLELIKKDPFETLNFIHKDLKYLDFNPSVHSKNTQLHNVSLEQLMEKLRIAKERTALLVAITDIGNVWELEQVVKALSDFADLAISEATKWILLNSHINKEINIENIENPEINSGFVILAMGKLGSKELNYSSDVDLISLYDQEKINYTGSDSPHKCFNRMTQLLINILSERTKDGYVFRTDLRLRPDAGATPISISMLAAETYYENVGQNWERAAMIKARPIAGDLDSGKQYINRLKPFIWRKNLDFAAISDIQSIKRQIDAKKNDKKFSIYGHNIKLGNGGIREIELFVQTQQLIAGGRDPLLREASTLNVLSILFERKKISIEAKKQLEEAYKFFRKLEHRLQMISDKQTHSIPKNHNDFSKFIKFLGYKEEKLFINMLERNINYVKLHYKKLFETSKELGNEKGSLIFTGSEDDPRTIDTLSLMGFKEPESIVKSIRDWHHGRYRATRSVRSREILTDLIPKLLKFISSTPSPDFSFKNFDRFLSKLSEGAQFFSLIQHNQTLLELLTKIVGSAPNLSEFLLYNPHVLDIIISNQSDNYTLTASELEKDLKLQISFSSNYIEKLDTFRRWTREHRFMIGTNVLRGKLNGFNSSKNFSTIAKVIIKNLLPIVQKEFQIKYGNFPHAKYSIVGLGTLGSEEMIFNSDLDLIFIYENKHKCSNSNGSISLPASTYFAKLSQKFINAITSLTTEGKVYEIDMRLRPSGNAGPVALSLDSFTSYHQKKSWTWEKMALTRARTIAGDKHFCKSIDKFINDTISTKINRNILIKDILNMRSKIEKEHLPKSIWRIKQIRGGLLDCQFLAQFFQLNLASKYPAILSKNTIKVFETLEKLDIYDKTILKTLKNNTVLQHNINSIMDLCLQDSKKINDDPIEIISVLLESTKFKNFEKLKFKLSKAQNEVFDIYNKIIQ